MSDKETKKEETVEKTVVAEKDIVVDANSTSTNSSEDNGKRKGGRDFKKNRRQSNRRPRQRQEFDQRIISLRRVTRVSSGGRRFSFSVAIIIGDKKGRIGVGTGKASDTAFAIEKAVSNAKKHMINVKMTHELSIPHEVSAKYCSGRVILMPAPGRGLIAGSAVRDIAELSGIQHINGKIVCGTKNKLNIAKATIKALNSLKKPYVSKKKKEKEVVIS